MIEVKTKLRRWGNSFGVVVPIGAVQKEHIEEGDDITVLVEKEKDNVLKEMFGTFKFKKSTEQMMKEMDEELYDD